MRSARPRGASLLGFPVRRPSSGQNYQRNGTIRDSAWAASDKPFDNTDKPVFTHDRTTNGSTDFPFDAVEIASLSKPRNPLRIQTFYQQDHPIQQHCAIR